jgi:hypothetical protein
MGAPTKHHNKWRARWTDSFGVRRSAIFTRHKLAAKFLTERASEARAAKKVRSRSKLTVRQREVLYRSLHRSLDMLVASFIDKTGKLPSETTVMDLMRWSYGQTKLPRRPSDHKRRHDVQVTVR